MWNLVVAWLTIGVLLYTVAMLRWRRIRPYRILTRGRTVFGRGVNFEVREYPASHCREFSQHGVIHGQQDTRWPQRMAAASYYIPGQPIADAFIALQAHSAFTTVGVAGLGIGTLACFGRPGQEFTFYEIDPAIIRLAQDPQLFTYLTDSKATIKVVEGDVLQTLPQTPAAYYDLLVMDAYDGHAPPLALLTRPALELYLSRLRPAGVLLLHLTSPRDLTSALSTTIAPLKTSLLLRQTPLGKGQTRWAALCADPAGLESLRLHPRPWTRPVTQAPN